MADLRRISIKTQKTVDEINDRLARIETHLGIGTQPPVEPESEPATAVDLAEAQVIGQPPVTVATRSHKPAKGG